MATICYIKRPEAPTYLFGENCLSDIIQAALAHRVLKCDVIKMKFLKLWDILKEQCPRGLLAKNEHLGANCL